MSAPLPRRVDLQILNQSPVPPQSAPTKQQPINSKQFNQLKLLQGQNHGPPQLAWYSNEVKSPNAPSNASLYAPQNITLETPVSSSPSNAPQGEIKTNTSYHSVPDYLNFSPYQTSYNIDPNTGAPVLYGTTPHASTFFNNPEDSVYKLLSYIIENIQNNPTYFQNTAIKDIINENPEISTLIEELPNLTNNNFNRFNEIPNSYNPNDFLNTKTAKSALNRLKLATFLTLYRHFLKGSVRKELNEIFNNYIRNYKESTEYKFLNYKSYELYKLIVIPILLVNLNKYISHVSVNLVELSNDNVTDENIRKYVFSIMELSILTYEEFLYFIYNSKVNTNGETKRGNSIYQNGGGIVTLLAGIVAGGSLVLSEIFRYQAIQNALKKTNELMEKNLNKFLHHVYGGNTDESESTSMRGLLNFYGIEKPNFDNTLEALKGKYTEGLSKNPEKEDPKNLFVELQNELNQIESPQFTINTETEENILKSINEKIQNDYNSVNSINKEEPLKRPLIPEINTEMSYDESTIKTKQVSGDLSEIKGFLEKLVVESDMQGKFKQIYQYIYRVIHAFGKDVLKAINNVREKITGEFIEEYKNSVYNKFQELNDASLGKKMLSVINGVFSFIGATQTGNVPVLTSGNLQVAIGDTILLAELTGNYINRWSLFISNLKQQINDMFLLIKTVIQKTYRLQVNFMSTALAASGARNAAIFFGTMGLSSVPAGTTALVTTGITGLDAIGNGNNIFGRILSSIGWNYIKEASFVSLYHSFIGFNTEEIRINPGILERMSEEIEQIPPQEIGYSQYSQVPPAPSYVGFTGTQQPGITTGFQPQQLGTTGGKKRKSRKNKKKSKKKLRKKRIKKRRKKRTKKRRKRRKRTRSKRKKK